MFQYYLHRSTDKLSYLKTLIYTKKNAQNTRSQYVWLPYVHVAASHAYAWQPTMCTHGDHLCAHVVIASDKKTIGLKEIRTNDFLS